MESWTPPAPVAQEVDERAAKAMYEASLDDSIHCNRYRAWSELSAPERAEWQARAALPRAMGELPELPASQAYVHVWNSRGYAGDSLQSANAAYYTADQMRAYARAARGEG